MATTFTLPADDIALLAEIVEDWLGEGFTTDPDKLERASLIADNLKEALAEDPARA